MAFFLKKIIRLFYRSTRPILPLLYYAPSFSSVASIVFRFFIFIFISISLFICLGSFFFFSFRISFLIASFCGICLFLHIAYNFSGMFFLFLLMSLAFFIFPFWFFLLLVFFLSSLLWIAFTL